MVNGGGSVLLELARQGLQSRLVWVSTSWNQFTHIDPVIMNALGEEYIEITHTPLLAPSSQCSPIQHRLRPVVHSSGGSAAATPLIRTSQYSVSPETGVLFSSVPLSIDSSSPINLVYTSSLSAGYQSTLFILLTSDVIPDELRIVHVRVEVEGVVHRVKLDAAEMLRYKTKPFSYTITNICEQKYYLCTNICGDIKIFY